MTKITHLRRSAIILGALMLLSLPVTGENPAPQGCHWQELTELNAQLAVPNDWSFRRVPSSGVLVFEVIPGGPAFLTASRSKYRLEVHKHQDPATVLSRAREFVESAVKTAFVTQPIDEQHMSTITLFSSAAQFLSPLDNTPLLTVVVSAAANSKTGTLYLVRFEIPAGEESRVAGPGNHLFQRMSLDDDV